MGDAQRTDAIVDPNSRAWEALLLTPLTPDTVTGGVGGSTATAAITPMTTSKNAASGGTAASEDGAVNPRLTTVPGVGELDRVRSKLTALRDGLKGRTSTPSLPLTVPGGGGSGGRVGDGSGGSSGGNSGGRGGGGDGYCDGGGDGEGDGGSKRGSGTASFEADDWWD